jgi:hypothetical protein
MAAFRSAAPTGAQAPSLVGEPAWARFCGHCGGTSDGGTSDGGTSDGEPSPPSDAHTGCYALLQLEPPRFCRECGRRLKVQVAPLTWWASCSRHGSFSG